MPAQIQKGNIGTAFRIEIKDQDDVVVDVSAATTIQIIFKKPGGDILTKTASFVTNGTDGMIQYVSQSGDLDTVGLWRHQGFVVQSGTEFWTDLAQFKVHRNLNESSC